MGYMDFWNAKKLVFWKADLREPQTVKVSRFSVTLQKVYLARNEKRLAARNEPLACNKNPEPFSLRKPLDSCRSSQMCHRTSADCTGTGYPASST